MKRYLKCIFCLIILLTFNNVNATPANDLFLDDNLYKCVIDSYNKENNLNLDHTYNILAEELVEIKSLDCSAYKGKIEDLTGLNKLISLNNLNLSGNTFLGGGLTITGSSGKLKSNLNLPTNLSITNISYKIDNPEIVKITENVVYPLKAGSTYVTMTGKVSGNEIIEKYLVTVSSNSTILSNNAKLASLYLSKGEFGFDSDKNVYNVVVDNEVSSVKINANLLDRKASFVSGFGPRTVDLKVGLNTLYVKVKAENGNINTYTISVTRSDGNDLNNRLINIELSVGKINFDPDVYIYNFNVDSNVDVIDVKAVSESALAKVEVSDTKLKVGNNKITITVTSESGSVQKYELIVTREDYDSLDNYLENLTIKNYEIKFERNKFNYEVTIENENKLEIQPICEKSDASYSIIGNNNLEDNSKIVIKVSDKEGSTREYTITVHKKALFDFNINNDLIKWGILIFEFITIIVLICILIFRRKNRLKKPKRPRKIRAPKPQSPASKTNSNVCRACGAVNDLKSKTCYICGNLLK